MKHLKKILIVIVIAHLEFSQSIQNFDTCDSPSITDNDRIVNTLNGKIQGDCYTVPVTYSNNETIDYSVFSWRGIPYAEPPLGRNRFMKSEPVSNWTDIRNGTEWPNGCAQTTPQNSLNQTSEDCLYLNIFVRNETYLNRATELKPVMVWIHGGSFASESGAADIYEPSTLVAAGDVIVATINYRLGIFGFLHLNETNATGNMGLMDQSLALKWIYDNADKFGGDRNKITIFGESAGAWSVGFHLFIEASWPYFRNAIMESGGAGGINNVYRLLSSEKATAKSIPAISKICNQKLNSDKLLCLQNASIDDLIIIYTANAMVLDNIVFKETISELISQEKFKKCNIITGANSKEEGLFLAIENLLTLNKDQFQNKMDTYFINDMVEVTSAMKLSMQLEYVNMSAYPSIDYTGDFISMKTDQMFSCQSFSNAEAYAKIGKNAYVYENDFIADSSPLGFIPKGVVHGEEMYQVFGEALSNKKPPLLNKYASPKNYSHSFEDKKLAEKMITYWTNFAKYDDPNYSDHLATIEKWEPFASKSTDLSVMSAVEKMNTGRYLLIANEKIKMMTGFSQHKCDFWEYTLDSSATSTLSNVIFILVLSFLVTSVIY